VPRGAAFEIVATLWPWIALPAAGIGAVAALWWALADFILDNVGPTPSEWGERGRG
jgi:hypothetical protein